MINKSIIRTAATLFPNSPNLTAAQLITVFSFMRYAEKSFVTYRKLHPLNPEMDMLSAVFGSLIKTIFKSESVEEYVTGIEGHSYSFSSLGKLQDNGKPVTENEVPSLPEYDAVTRARIFNGTTAFETIFKEYLERHPHDDMAHGIAVFALTAISALYGGYGNAEGYLTSQKIEYLLLTGSLEFLIRNDNKYIMTCPRCGAQYEIPVDDASSILKLNEFGAAECCPACALSEDERRKKWESIRITVFEDKA